MFQCRPYGRNRKMRCIGKQPGAACMNNCCFSKRKMASLPFLWSKTLTDLKISLLDAPKSRVTCEFSCACGIKYSLDSIALSSRMWVSIQEQRNIEFTHIYFLTYPHGDDDCTLFPNKHGSSSGSCGSDSWYLAVIERRWEVARFADDHDEIAEEESNPACGSNGTVTICASEDRHSEWYCQADLVRASLTAGKEWASYSLCLIV